MKHALRSILLLLFLCHALPASPIVREPGVIYLSDFQIKPVHLKLLKAAPCYFDSIQSRFAGTLRFPQSVRLEAIDQSNGMFRIKGNALQGGVLAWVDPALFEPLPDQFLADIKKSEERRLKVQALISKNEVAIGMTPEEVRQSLGKPQKTTNRANKEGSSQTWEYIKYDLIPQATYAPAFNQTVVNFPGQPPARPGCPPRPGVTLAQGSSTYSASTVYIKVPVGTLTVSFKNNLVDSLDQSEGTTAGGEVSVVIPPVNVYW